MAVDLAAVWRRFHATREPALRDTLVRETIWLVRKVAGRLALRLPRHVELDDLEAAGVPGLLAAIESFDPTKEVDFPAYAQARIRGAILDELRSLDPLPRSLRLKSRQIERAIAELEHRLLRSPSDEEVAQHLGVSLADFHETLHALRGGLHVSLENGGGDGEEEGPPAAVAVAEAQTPDPWSCLALKERQALLAQVIEDLPKPERLVLSLYYVEELTMKEVGAVLEISESRVSQIHSAALLRIRSRLRRQRVAADDLRVDRRPAPGVAYAVSVALLAAVLLLGCAARRAPLPDPELTAEIGRSSVLVVPVFREPENAGQAEQAARLFEAELGLKWCNVVESTAVLRSSPELVRELPQMTADLLAGRAVHPEVGSRLARQHGVSLLLLVDVYRNEQYWGRKVKATRVGVDARLVQALEGRTLWQGRHEPELAGFAGHAVDMGTRRAVQELVRLLTHGPRPVLSPATLDRLADWPIVEHFAPN